jgi:hypothetical protein
MHIQDPTQTKSQGQPSPKPQELNPVPGSPSSLLAEEAKIVHA